MKRFRVLVADDHPPVRAGVRLALEAAEFTVCAEVGDASSAVSAAIRERPDVCLLDVYMPGGGISAAREISARLPETEIVMLTISRDDDDLLDALRAGAAGYLLKDIDPLRLPAALKHVLAGEAAMPRSLVAALVDEVRRRGKPRRLRLLGRPGVRLTEREWEVLELMREGLRTAEIARRLGISAVTVRRHVSDLLCKLDVPDRKTAVGLVEERSPI
jgi:DNA-binding NarL/FixJ family response regulator